MKRITLLITFGFLLHGCSEDLNQTSSAPVDLSATSENQTGFGIYKGIFTTLDSKYRGTLEISIPQVAYGVPGDMAAPMAVLTLHNGEVVIANGPKGLGLHDLIEGVRFESAEFSFMLQQDSATGSPMVVGSRFRGFDSDIVVARHTTRDPVTPVSGTYLCTECGGHPKLGTGLPQTFNMLFTVSDGEGGIITQTTLGARANSGIGYQSGCAAGGAIYSSCMIESGDGSTTNVGYLANGNPVIWSGTHVYNNQPSSADDCSGIFGNWEWMSNGYGLLTGIFISDNHCFEEISFEDFEDATFEFIPSVPLYTDGEGDFFTNTDGSNVTGDYSVSGVFGSSWFAAMDTDGDDPALTEVFLDFPDMDGSLYYGALLEFHVAEDDATSGEDWSSNTEFLIEYSYNGGLTYTTAYAIQSTGGMNTEPSVDEDLDGMGDGTTPITDTFQFQFSKPTYEVDPAASQDFDVSVKLRLSFRDLTEDGQDMSVDNVRVMGFRKGH